MTWLGWLCLAMLGYAWLCWQKGIDNYQGVEGRIVFLSSLESGGVGSIYVKGEGIMWRE